MAFPGEAEAETPSSVRPKNAAVSCSHFWACALVAAGLAELVLGTIIFGGECQLLLLYDAVAVDGVLE